VPTRLEAGHANNALPQRATANINCRILPGHSLEEVRQELIRIIDDPKVTVRYVSLAGQILDTASGTMALPPVTLSPEVMQPLQRVVAEMWQVPLIPGMDTGASDGVYLDSAGIPTYGITGVGVDVGDVRAHGKDERVRAQAFYAGLDLKALTGAH
jgi:acetylornithine deacetylase/succinyl-diaminopimelate desuccinylase-like protein